VGEQSEIIREEKLVWKEGKNQNGKTVDLRGGKGETSRFLWDRGKNVGAVGGGVPN